MLDKLRRLYDRISASEPQTLAFEDHKLAAAALLVHATHVDGRTDAVEQAKLRALLAAHYNLADDEVLQLLRLGEQQEKEAVDLYGFTRRISQQLPPAERLALIEMLWEIAYSDGTLHEFEDNLVWRVSELLHVPARERMLLRQKVEARTKGKGGA